VAEEIIRAATIAISGNRDYPDRAGLFRGLDRLRGDRYLMGGARGADTDALDYLSTSQPGSQRVVVVPNRLQDQPAIARASITKNASQVIELKNAGNDRYQIRNRYLVDKSNRLAAFTDGRQTGGTFNTIKYASSRGVPVDIMPLVEMDEALVLSTTESEFNTWLDTAVKAQVRKLSIKSLVIKRMKMLARSQWQGVLSKLEMLK
jgi:hypothetical protein